ncbi:MAG: hypothetical protein FD170_398 [Bacteroidetes bacterium]|nr:MAG: hypothetical protein FD170_398 [Bacteroidota bacterium]
MNGKKSGRPSSLSSLVRRFFRKPGKKRKSLHSIRVISSNIPQARKRRNKIKTRWLYKIKRLFRKTEEVRFINPKKLAANIANRNLNTNPGTIHTAPVISSVDTSTLQDQTLKQEPGKNEITEVVSIIRKPARRSKPLQKWLRRIKKTFRKKKSVRIIKPESLAANAINKNLNPASGMDSEDNRLLRVSSPRRHAHRHVRRKISLIQFESEGSPLKKQVVEDNTLPGVRLKKILSSIDLRAILNSLGLFILSYLFIYLVYQAATIAVASVYGIDAVLYYYEVYFPIGNTSSLWTKTNIIAITLIGPLVCGSLSVLLFRIIQAKQIDNHILRLFLLWVAFQGAAHFLGAFVAGIITNLGFGYVANWMFMNVFFKILVSLVFLFVLSLSGYYSTNAAMSNLPHGKRKYENRVGAMLSTYIIPWLLGTLMLFLVRSPDRAPQHEYINAYDTIILASIVFAIMPMIFRRHLLKYSGKIRGKTVSFTKGLLVLLMAVIILIAFRLALSPGIHFVINLDFGAGFYN